MPRRVSAFLASLTFLVSPLAAHGATFAEVEALCVAVTQCPNDQGQDLQKRAPALAKVCALSGESGTKAWKDLFQDFPRPSELTQVKACATKGLQAEGAPSTAQLASNVLWGTTEFVLNRAEEELRTWVVDDFLDKVCNKGLGDLVVEVAGPDHEKAGVPKPADAGAGTPAPADAPKPLFPRTCALASEIHLRGFGSALPSLREAMRQDLRHLPTLVFDEVVRESQQTGQTQTQDLALVGFASASAAELVLDGATVVGAMKQLARAEFPAKPDCKLHPAATTVLATSMLVSALTSNGAPNRLTWPQTSQGWSHALIAVEMNRRDDEVLKASWTCEGNEELGFDVRPILATLGRLQDALGTIQDSSKQYSAAIATGAVPRAVYAQLAEGGVMLLQAVVGAIPTPPPSVVKANLVLGDLRGVCQATGAEDYPALVVDVIQVVTDAGLLESSDPNKPKPKVRLPESFVRLVAFAGDLAAAKDAKGVSEALERAAAPVGAYRKKRLAQGWYGSFNAYFGGMAAAEWAKAKSGKAEPAFAPGFWLPVGLEFGRSYRGFSYGLLVQAIDLGTLATWRVKHDDDLNTAPRVAFSSVVSPGAWVMLGWARAPISLGAGVAYAPKLRTLSDPEGHQKERDALRAGVVVAVDIPIFD